MLIFEIMQIHFHWLESDGSMHIKSFQQQVCGMLPIKPESIANDKRAECSLTSKLLKVVLLFLVWSHITRLKVGEVSFPSLPMAILVLGSASNLSDQHFCPKILFLWPLWMCPIPKVAEFQNSFPSQLQMKRREEMLEVRQIISCSANSLHYPFCW